MGGGTDGAVGGGVIGGPPPGLSCGPPPGLAGLPGTTLSKSPTALSAPLPVAGDSSPGGEALGVVGGDGFFAVNDALDVELEPDSYSIAEDAVSAVLNNSD